MGDSTGKRGWSKANQRQNSRRRPRYEAYRNRNQREINKGIGLLKHMERQPEDVRAKAAFDGLPILAQRDARRELVKRRED